MSRTGKVAASPPEQLERVHLARGAAFETMEREVLKLKRLSEDSEKPLETSLAKALNDYTARLNDTLRNERDMERMDVAIDRVADIELEKMIDDMAARKAARISQQRDWAEKKAEQRAEEMLASADHSLADDAESTTIKRKRVTA